MIAYAIFKLKGFIYIYIYMKKGYKYTYRLFLQLPSSVRLRSVVSLNWQPLSKKKILTFII